MRVDFTNGWSAKIRDLSFKDMASIREGVSDTEMVNLCVQEVLDPHGKPVAVDQAPNAVVLSACAEAVKAANAPLATTGSDTDTTAPSEETE